MTRNEHWIAFVPEAARWPYEVRIFPAVRVPDLPATGEAAREAFGPLYLDVLRRFDALFTGPAPYIAAWHQAPVKDEATRTRVRRAPSGTVGPASGRQTQVPGWDGIRDGRVD